MGRFSLHGWPHYFLVTLLLKMPLGTWAAVLLALGLAAVRRRAPAGREVLTALALCVAVLASVARAGINAGHRHVVVVEALLAYAAAGGLALALAEVGRRRRALVGAAVAALAAGGVASLRTHPDALGYTNLLAGSDPDWWLIDSNLDWGQDLERLRAELQARGVDEEIHLAYFGIAEPARHGLRFRWLEPGEQATGWIAISVHEQRGMVHAGIGHLPSPSERDGYRWLWAYTPVARIGTSMRLYHVPAGPAAPAAGATGR
jgi:hypothetical protein